MGVAVASRPGAAVRFCAADPADPALLLWSATQTVEATGDRPLGGGAILIAADLDEVTLPAILLCDGRTVCAATAQPDRAPKIMRLARRPRALFSLCVDTRTGMDLDMGGAIRRALEADGRIGGEMADDLETCLHEAISNALVHGNLGLGSQLRETPEAYLQYAALLEERLGDPTRGGRLVYIRCAALRRGVAIAIGDEGGGIPGGPPKISLGDASARCSGRGLALIRTMARDLRHRDGGRLCVMRFGGDGA